VDLRECGITAPGIRAIFPALAAFITAAKLEPYRVAERRGELKHVLVTEAADGQLMLRFVVRSEHLIGQIRKRLPELRAAIPRLRVVSVNLLPEHKAVLEGEREEVLTESDALPMTVNGIDLLLGARSFFQTNTAVAAALYRQGRDWVNEAAPASAWDLFCGVGGFALHSQAPDRSVTGIEFSAEAIASAEQTRDALHAAHPGAGYDRVRFASGDATAFALGEGNDPELVIVNPPRRGIGPELAARLEASAVSRVVYSSCNPDSLAADLAAMPSLRPARGRLFDMFPHTTHAEVMVLLERG
ncbi:methyltransferase domain-containing protein, partial [Leucobacter sp. M11]|uniref:methyltransferase domain-containing protein n=1 Tax=Leucobacter sp. M11 TaxID=2993565 RepID=UPI002D8114A7